MSTSRRSDIEARLAQRFDRADVAVLLAARDGKIAAVDVADAGQAVRFVRALVAAGAVAASSGRLVATVATADQLARTARAEPEFAAEFAALERAVRNATDPPGHLRLRERSLDLRDTACVMGILNVTPDSFYERVSGIAEAVDRACAMAAAGAALVDIGGQSYAHWNQPVAAAQERQRVVPAVNALVAAGLDIGLSIDTFKASVADAALAAGAHLINDCSGLSDPLMAETVARHDAGLVIMHLKGELNVRRAESYRYADVLAEIVEFLHERIERARAAGVAADSIAVDPGLEFGKEPATDLEILDRFHELTVLGCPIVLASSRKSFLGRLFNRPADQLLSASLATAGLGIAAGARILRVHDVAETVQFAQMYAAVSPHRRSRLEVAERMPGTPADPGNSAPASSV